MNIFRCIFLLPVFLLLYLMNGYSKQKIEVNKTDKYSYTMSCEISFPNNVSPQLMDFCWNTENISKIVEDEPVKVEYSGNELNQTISYDYKFLFMHYYSTYEREKSISSGKINFKLVKNECHIPFVPNITSGYGEYSFTTNTNTTTFRYVQYSTCDGWLSDFYLDYVKSDIAKYFKKFEAEFNQSIQHAKN